MLFGISEKYTQLDKSFIVTGKCAYNNILFTY